MNRRLVRRLAVALIALLAFAQASVAFGGCFMDRADMAQMAGDSDCCGTTPQFEPLAQLKNDCLAHCTADLQLSGEPAALVRIPADVLVFVLPHRSAPYFAAPPPPPLIPPRILLHSYLI